MSYITLKSNVYPGQDFIRCIEQADEHHQKDGCTWCGQFRKNQTLFRYGYETASGHSCWDSKAFCSLSCRKSYVM